MEEREIRFHFDTRTNKTGLDDVKDSDHCKHRIVKDKYGYFKWYCKYIGNSKFKKDMFRLDSIHYAMGDEKNGMSVSVYEVGPCDTRWYSYWKDVIEDIYKYLNNLPEAGREDVFKVFQDLYGGVLAFKIAVMKNEPSHAMTEDHGKLMKRYGGWYYIEFDSTFWDAFSCDHLEKILNKRGIFNAHWQYEEGRMWMFFKKMTGKKLELAVRRFNFLMGVQRDLGKKVRKFTEDFFYETKPWNKIPEKNHTYKRPYIYRNK